MSNAQHNANYFFKDTIITLNCRRYTCYQEENEQLHDSTAVHSSTGYYILCTCAMGQGKEYQGGGEATGGNWQGQREIGAWE